MKKLSLFWKQIYILLSLYDSMAQRVNETIKRSEMYFRLEHMLVLTLLTSQDEDFLKSGSSDKKIPMAIKMNLSQISSSK